MNPIELAANGLNTLSILLAGRNSVHTWWVGILGCATFGWLFYGHQLYADATLQGFFMVSSAVGWWRWLSVAPQRGDRRVGAAERVKESALRQLPVRRCPPERIALWTLGGVAGAAGYGWLLHRYTDAYAPFPDSAVLAFSIVGQFLLMGRRVEAWWFWIVVNTIAAPLFFFRGLHLTAVLYLGYWIHALVALRHWRRLARAHEALGAPGESGGSSCRG